MLEKIDISNANFSSKTDFIKYWNDYCSLVLFEKYFELSFSKTMNIGKTRDYIEVIFEKYFYT